MIQASDYYSLLEKYWYEGLAPQWKCFLLLAVFIALRHPLNQSGKRILAETTLAALILSILRGLTIDPHELELTGKLNFMDWLQYATLPFVFFSAVYAGFLIATKKRW